MRDYTCGVIVTNWRESEPNGEHTREEKKKKKVEGIEKNVCCEYTESRTTARPETAKRKTHSERQRERSKIGDAYIVMYAVFRRADIEWNSQCRH